MIEKFLVFLSSTSQMKAERDELQKTLPHLYELYRYEDERPGKQTAQERCEEMIQKADVLVGILGRDYGTSLSSESKGQSIVEWEIDTAVKSGRSEVMAFIKVLAPGEIFEPRQRAFVDRISAFSSGMFWKPYNNPSDLTKSVHFALQELLTERFVTLKKRLPKLQSFASKLLLSIAGFAVLLLLVISLTPVCGRFSTPSMIAFTGVVISIVLLCGILQLRELR